MRAEANVLFKLSKSCIQSAGLTMDDAGPHPGHRLVQLGPKPAWNHAQARPIKKLSDVGAGVPSSGDLLAGSAKARPAYCVGACADVDKVGCPYEYMQKRNQH